MRHESGRRVCVRTVDDNGLPLVRYGTVKETTTADGPLIVAFDDSPHGEIVDRSEVQAVDITSVELTTTGVDLADLPNLRQGLAAMWRAEADLAGVTVIAMYPLGAGLRDGTDTWALAEVSDGTETYVVRVHTDPNEPNTVRVRADRANRWDW